jgi:hypothetical protein
MHGYLKQKTYVHVNARVTQWAVLESNGMVLQASTRNLQHINFEINLSLLYAFENFLKLCVWHKVVCTGVLISP